MAGGSIELSGLTKKFSEIAVDNIDLTVPSGEFSPVDADDFTIMLSALLDGFAVQIALDDPAVPPQRTYDLAMRFASGQLGFDWKPAPAGRRTRTRAS